MFTINMSSVHDHTLGNTNGTYFALLITHDGPHGSCICPKCSRNEAMRHCRSTKHQRPFDLQFHNAQNNETFLLNMYKSVIFIVYVYICKSSLLNPITAVAGCPGDGDPRIRLQYPTPTAREYSFLCSKCLADCGHNIRLSICYHGWDIML